MRRTVGFLALVGLLALSAAGYASPQPTISDDSAITRAPGCGELPPSTATPKDMRVTTVVPKESAPTAFEHVDARLDLWAVLEDARRILGDYEVVASHVLPSSGITVEIRSDGPLEVDATELDLLARLPLERHATYADARVAALLRCYERRVVEERELAGTKLRVHVPSAHAACFRLGRLAEVGPDGYRSTCDAAGVTLPPTPVRLKLLGMEVVRLGRDASIIVSGSSRSIDRANDRLAWHLLHEFIHHYDNSLGLGPLTGALTHYEQRAYYVERSLRGQFRAAGTPPPFAIRYVPLPPVK